MSTESLFEIYPWYRQHQCAVDTVATCLQVEVEQVLKGLDKKIGAKGQGGSVDVPKAA